MFNHHFFEEDIAKSVLQSFFAKARLDSILVVMDPPFGGLVEVLAVSLRKMWKLADSDKKCKGISF